MILTGSIWSHTIELGCKNSDIEINHKISKWWPNPTVWLTINSSTQKLGLEASQMVPLGQLPTTSEGIVAPKQNANVVREVQANTWLALHTPQLEVSPQLAGNVLRWKHIVGRYVQTMPSGQLNNCLVFGMPSKWTNSRKVHDFQEYIEKLQKKTYHRSTYNMRSRSHRLHGCPGTHCKLQVLVYIEFHWWETQLTGTTKKKEKKNLRFIVWFGKAFKREVLRDLHINWGIG